MENPRSPDRSNDETTAVQVEALIFAARGVATPAQIRRAIADLTPARLASIVDRINAELSESGRPYEIVEVSGGYQFRTRQEYADVVRATQPDRTARLSRAALETLAVVAYRQPITRAEVEDVRSVDCGAVLRGLLDRGLLRIAGRRDAPGRPALYGTSARFLEIFGLRSLRDLPPIGELRERTLGPSATDPSPERPLEREGTPAAGEPAPQANGAG